MPASQRVLVSLGRAASIAPALSYSTGGAGRPGGGGGGAVNVFDRSAKRKQRARAAMAPDAHLYDYLKDHVGRSYIL